MMSWPKRMCPQRSGSAMVSENQYRLNPGEQSERAAHDGKVRSCHHANRSHHGMVARLVATEDRKPVYTKYLRDHGFFDFFLDF